MAWREEERLEMTYKVAAKFYSGERFWTYDAASPEIAVRKYADAALPGTPTTISHRGGDIYDVCDAAGAQLIGVRVELNGSAP
jgi:hypothetical protein